ncbi:hypothetical protein LCL95_00500 [Bacillus timonensis]|nr:hypothetical protein [Bacillus timonensis]
MSQPKITIAIYRPFEGKKQELLTVLEKHIPTLTNEHLITDRTPILMEAEDGTIIEIFEWASTKAIDKAHTSEAVGKIWGEIERLSELSNLASLSESQYPFPNFKPLN